MAAWAHAVKYHCFAQIHFHSESCRIRISRMHICHVGDLKYNNITAILKKIIYPESLLKLMRVFADWGRKL